MPNNGFFPAPDYPNRTVYAYLMQFFCSQRQNYLHRHVLAPTKRAANGRINYSHLFQRNLQCVRDLFLIFVRPLTGNNDRNHALFVDIRNTRFRLQKRVLLNRRVIFPLTNDSAA